MPRRQALVAGNWKMNPVDREAATRLAREITAAVRVPTATTVVVCPPTIWLADVAAVLAASPIRVGAQTMAAAESGAFTGETSPLMLSGLATHVILGHSERRANEGETDAGVGRKVASAVDHGLVPIAAVGERLDERRDGATAAVIDRQLRAAIAGLERIGGTSLVIAYEPVWAIGTGEAASADDAQEVAAQIRSILRERDAEGAEEVPILYGGSVTPENADRFFGCADVDGALVGGASLDAAQFAAIVRAAGAAA